MGFLSTITDPHRDWFGERNRLVTVSNSIEDDGLADRVLDDVVALEKRIVATPARTADALLTKLLMLVQLTAEGHDINEDTAAVAVREAMQVVDMGSLVSVSDETRAVIGEGR